MQDARETMMRLDVCAFVTHYIAVWIVVH